MGSSFTKGELSFFQTFLLISESWYSCRLVWPANIEAKKAFTILISSVSLGTRVSALIQQQAHIILDRPFAAGMLVVALLILHQTKL